MREIVKEVKHLILTSASFVPKHEAITTSSTRPHHVATQSSDFDVAIKSHELAATLTTHDSNVKPIVVTAKVHDYYLNALDNELSIPSGELARTIVLDREHVLRMRHAMSKMDLKLDVSWADASISLRVDPEEALFIFGLDSKNRGPVMPSASSLVSYHVQQFKKSYYAQQGIVEEDATVPHPGEKLIVDSSSPENDIPERFILTSY